MGFFDTIGKMKDNFLQRMGKVKNKISETIGKVKSITSSLRAKSTSNKLTQQLATYGDVEISQLQYSRKPIQKAISTALNIMTLGSVDKTKNRLGYSDIYHDSIIVHLKTGELLRLEKNAYIELSYFTKEPAELIYNVPFSGRKLSLNVLLTTAREGNSKFYEYDHQTNNCQSFANDIIVKNNLSSAELESKIKKQDAQALTSALPDDINNVMNIATDLGSFTQDIQNSFK